MLTTPTRITTASKPLTTKLLSSLSYSHSQSHSHSTTANPTPTMKITPRPSSSRGHASHGWLNTHHTFSFASYHDPLYTSFGALRVLNEDRVAPSSGFPTHPHRDAEIFSYILSGELTHRDSMLEHRSESDMLKNKNDFFRMRRGDVQFTTGGTGIAHSEQNEREDSEVHFLQIWATPWKRGLPPTYHTGTFPDVDKRNKFVTILSPLKAGPEATREEEKAAIPVVKGSIPIHADFLMGAAIIGKGKEVAWRVGGEGEGAVSEREKRKVYVHLPMRGLGAKVVLGGEVELGEGDGAFVDGVRGGEEMGVESVGEGEAEVVVLDTC